MSHDTHQHVNHLQTESDSFEPIFNRTAVSTAWRTFVAEGRIAETAVSEEIAASWQRSAAHGVDPFGPAAPLVEQPELDTRLRNNRDLLIAAEHTWRLLSESLVASDNVFIVADPDGVTLDVRGNEEFVAAAARQYCGVGRNWHEAVIGTNAIGTALALNAPVLIRSAEHFVEAAKVWDCAAAPIHDLSSGALLGILDITSVGDLSDHHSLALAVTAGNQIEQALHSLALAHSIQLLNWFRGAVRPWRGQSAVLLDRHGQILRATKAARAYVESQSPMFEIKNDRPQFVEADSGRIVDVLHYKPPPEMRDDLDYGRWSGGIVLLEHDGNVSARRHSISSGADVSPAFGRIVTTDRRLIELMRRAQRMAKATAPVLLLGETGTGKELFAGAMHAESAVHKGPFVAVNCGTLTRELAASELLGYEPGAFTGAAASGRRGKFEEADGGTLFLDEIGELPLDVQVHLLRALQDGVIVRVGGNNAREVSVRVIAATHRDLDQEVHAGRFREDLLFRLRVLTLSLPPLRERPGDIRPLVERHLIQLQERYGLGTKTPSEDLIAMLSRHPWPGNVRELLGLVENMYILSDRPRLTPAELPDGFTIASPVATTRAANQPAGRDLDRHERDALLNEIERQRHNMSAVARSFGISRSTLYRKLKRFGIEPRTSE